jgi:hypothetical protein
MPVVVMRLLAMKAHISHPLAIQTSTMKKPLKWRLMIGLSFQMSQHFLHMGVRSP